jgi:hypothetical protein
MNTKQELLKPGGGVLDHNAALPSGYLPTADQVTVQVDGIPLRVVRYSHFDVPVYFVHGSLQEGVDHDVSVTIKRYQGSCRLFPERLGIRLPRPAHKKPLVFTIRDNPYLVLESDGLGYVLLAFDPAQSEPQGTGVLRADEVGVLPDAGRVQTAAIQAAIDRVAADSALHTLVLPAGLYRAGDLHLRSHVRLHLARGAVLKASDRAADLGDPSVKGWDRDRATFIHASDCEEIAITGHGHIDGNRTVLDLEQYHKGLVRLLGCRQVRLEGPVFSDPCNWNTHLRACEEVLVRRLKVLNNRPMMVCINTDGVNPDCSRRVSIEHCLMHTGDDAVAVKSCDHGDGRLRDVADITVTDLLAINNSTTAKIGTETCAAVMERIRFVRIDAVRTARLCAVDAFDYAHIRDIVFEDCHVHDLDNHRPDGVATDRLIDLHASATTWRAVGGKSRISNVTLRNISSEESGRCVFTGLDSEYGVRGVTLDRVTSGGRRLVSSDVERHGGVEGVTVMA